MTLNFMTFRAGSRHKLWKKFVIQLLNWSKRSTMNRELFGTDGVRGLAGEYPLNAEGAKRIGMAVGAHFAQPGQLVVLGRDPRESSAELASHLTAGLNSVGVS